MKEDIVVVEAEEALVEDEEVEEDLAEDVEVVDLTEEGE